MQDNDTQDLIINTMTKAQFESIENPSATELWFVEEPEETEFAKDSQVVHNTGKETIAGDKTFTGNIVLNSATTKTLDITNNSNALASTAFVQNLIASLVARIEELENK